MDNRIDLKPLIIEDLSGNEGTKNPGIDSLPPELMIEIFSNLDLKSLHTSVALTCKLWNAVSKDSALTRNLFFKTLPETAKSLSRTNLDENFFLQSLIADARMRSTSGKIKPSLTRINLDYLTCLKLIDGNIFAGKIGIIYILDGKTGKEIKRLKGHMSNVTDAIMSKGKLFSSSTDGTIHIWDFEKEEIIKVLKGHKDSVTKLCIFNGNLISTSWDNTLRLWDIETGNELKVLTPPNYSPNFCLSDGKIFSVTEDRKFYIWDAKTGEEIKVIEYSGPVQKIIAAKGKLFIALKEGVIHMLDIETNKLKTLEGHKNSVNALVEAQGKLFSGSKDHTIRIWDVESGRELRTLEGQCDRITHIDVLDKNLISYSRDPISRLSEDRIIRLWDIETGNELRKFETSNLSADNSLVILLNIQLAVGKIIARSSGSIFILDFNP